MLRNGSIARREFLVGLGAAAAATAAASLPGHALVTPAPLPGSMDSPLEDQQKTGQAQAMNSPFRVAVINDEISQDFGRACEVASREFGMQWIELRGMWSKNILNLDSNEVAEARRILDKFQLRVTDIASPLFKVDWKGAPVSKFRGHGGGFNADFSFDQQDEVLERSIELAKTFQTDRVRCFDFWRLDDQKPYRAAINEKLLEAANKAGKKGITLLLENDAGLNTATGAEAAKVLAAVQSPFLMMNWDPGNAAASGEKPFPDGYNLLPKDRIGHCHCKDAVKKDNDYDWAPMGAGIVDWLGQFEALKRDGYHFAVSLETHWAGGGTPEDSSRRSWAGMKELLQKAGAL
jgi:L-ribulose-5-phosphate 3-epimerase